MTGPDGQGDRAKDARLQSVLGRFALGVVRALSFFVPAAERPAWRREWHAELWYRERALAERPFWIRSSRLLGPLPGAFVYALILGVEGLRPEALQRDLRFALRSLRRAPAYAGVSLVTLGLGAGAALAVLAVVQGALLTPYAYGSPKRIVVLGAEDSECPGRLQTLAYPEIGEITDLGVFESVTAYDWEPFNVRLEDRTEWIGAGSVSPNVFQTLGITPIQGRSFVPSDGRAGAAPVVIIGAGLRDRVFGDGPVIGRSLSLDGTLYEVIGVAPDELDIPAGAEMWVPLQPGSLAMKREVRWLRAYGRLGPEVTRDQAVVALDALQFRLAAAFPGDYDGRTFRAIRLRDFRTGDVRIALLSLAGAVALVLVIVGANLASLSIARSEHRAAEFSVRRALGAGTGSLCRQLLAEGALLGVGAGCLGLVAGSGSLRMLMTMIPEHPVWFAPSVGPLLAAVVLTGALTTACGVSLFPMLIRSPTLVVADVRRARGPSNLRDLLVFGQVALTTVLLLGAGVLVKSLTQLSKVDPGFEAASRVSGTLQLPSARYPDDESVLEFVDALEERLRAAPAVASVGVVTRLPFQSGINSVMWWEEGQLEDAYLENPEAELNSVSPGYFDAMGIATKRGRPLAPSDGAESRRVVTVSEAFVREHFGDRNPIGSRISFVYPPRFVEIVGVVEDVKHERLAQEPSLQIYMSYRQRPTGRLSVVVEGRGTRSETLSATAQAIREVVRGLAPDLAISEMNVLEETVRASVWRIRLLTLVAWACALFATLLAAIGVFGVVAHSVAQRTKEIGIRVALGAQAPSVISLVCGRTATVVSSGLLIGAMAGLALERLAEGMLFGMVPGDPRIYLGTVIGFLAVGAVAAWLPAVRAARVDPVAAIQAT